jgi:hypothetical protein
MNDDFIPEKMHEKTTGFTLNEEIETMTKIEKQKIWRIQRSVENFVLSKNIKRKMEAVEDLMSMKHMIVNGTQYNLNLEKQGRLPIFQITKNIERPGSPRFVPVINASY